MSDRPSLLIVSSSNTRPKSLIKLITKTTNVQDGDNKITHPWTLDTKYYTAEIDVIGINEHFQRTQEFNDNVEALIIHMDVNRETGLEDLSVWLRIEEECEPEIKLLLANYCTEETKVTKERALEWCLAHDFELIELYPSQKPASDQDIIEEKVGVERVIEALQAHTWSNLVMKNEKKEDLAEICDEFLTAEGADDFSELFAQLSMMKESFQSLPMGQRKQCAEQVVTAFWEAIGGAEEEISDL